LGVASNPEGCPHAFKLLILHRVDTVGKFDPCCKFMDRVYGEESPDQVIGNETDYDRNWERYCSESK
jgi:hypothetical protein